MRKPGCSTVTTYRLAGKPRRWYSPRSLDVAGYRTIVAWSSAWIAALGTGRPEESRMTPKSSTRPAWAKASSGNNTMPANMRNPKARNLMKLLINDDVLLPQQQKNGVSNGRVDDVAPEARPYCAAQRRQSLPCA